MFYRDKGKVRIANTLVILIIVSLCVINISCSCIAEKSGSNSYSNGIIEQAIRQAVNKPDGPLLPSDLESIKYLDLSFDLPMGPIKDISSIKDLTNLEELNLRKTQVTDISPLASLKNLTKLDLSMNQVVKDLSPLTSIPSLTELNLNWCYSVKDITPLSSLVNLEKLYMDRVKVNDISPLSSLKSLKTLTLLCHRIIDISPISSLKELERLVLDAQWVEDISPLSSLANLVRLEIYDVSLTDISPIVSLTNLNTLVLSSVRPEDISCLLSLPSLNTIKFGWSYEITGIQELSEEELRDKLDKLLYWQQNKPVFIPVDEEELSEIEFPIDSEKEAVKYAKLDLDVVKCLDKFKSEGISVGTNAYKSEDSPLWYVLFSAEGWKDYWYEFVFFPDGTILWKGYGSV